MIAAAHIWILPLALVLDFAIGDPPNLWSRVPHPVALIGGLIGWLEKALNRRVWTDRARAGAGALTLAVAVAVAAAAGWFIEWLLAALPFGWIGVAVVAAVLFAGRSLHDHVAAAADAFMDGLPAARAAISHVVGRDPGSLDEPRICRAAIETTAENFSDGVVAPAFWFLLLGLPGLFAYKAINTADSMIGHSDRHFAAFGRTAARVDDLVNLPASRIAGTLIALAAPVVRGGIGEALRVMVRDAPGHRSPNAGWPEAAMAGALGVALAGPRRYRSGLVDDPFLNEAGRYDTHPQDIRRGLRVYLAANALLLLVAVALAVPVVL